MQSHAKTIITLQLLLVFYSISGILSKLAAGTAFFSIDFLGLYLGVLFILGIYAIVWQQILKHIPLTTAYSNRAITVVWGILWGFLFFGEPITLGRIIGSGIIIIGIILYSHSSHNDKANQPCADISKQT